MLLAWAAFLGGFIGLIGGGELLVFATINLATSMNISQAVIATTVVAFGSSLPELLISVFAALNGSGDLAFGNVNGSNIQNIALVLGLSAMVRPYKTDPHTAQDNGFYFLVSPLLLIVLAANLTIGRFEGAILLAVFGLFLINVIKKSRARATDNGPRPPKLSLVKYLLDIGGIVAGLTLLYFSAKMTLFGAIKIAESFGLSERVIGLTIVAFGTSLPELFICIVAAYRQKATIIIGNIIGSNIYNSLAIIGTSAAIAPMVVDKRAIYLDAMVMLTFTAFAFYICRFKEKITRPIGAFLIVACITYNIFLFI